MGEKAFNAVLVAVLLYVAWLPNGVLRSTVTQWFADNRAAERVEANWELVSEGGVPLGDPRTAPQIVVFSDYQCPFCRRVHPVIEEFLVANPGAGVVYRHFPLVEIHPHAAEAARATVCAEAQDVFRGLHDYLMVDGEWMNGPDWAAIGETVGIPDRARFLECIGDPETDALVQRDVSVAESLEISGTPSFVFRYGIREGVVGLENLEEMMISGR